MRLHHLSCRALAVLALCGTAASSFSAEPAAVDSAAVCAMHQQISQNVPPECQISTRDISKHKKTFKKDVEPKSVQVERLNFDLNAAVIREEAKPFLNVLAETLAADTSDNEGKHLIAGHTDATGSAALNNDLSKRRAEAVRDYLVQRVQETHGADVAGKVRARLETAGKGSDSPLTGSDPKDPLNRRVSVSLELPKT